MALLHSFFLTSLCAAFFTLHQFPATAEVDLISRTCQSTKFPGLCVSSLKSDPTSPNADTKGLAVIMVGIGMANATATSSYLSHLLNNNNNNNTTTRSNEMMTMTKKKLVKDCSDKYLYARNALRDSLQDLAEENYDYAFMHISAAADYPNVCHNGFKRMKGLVYPAELARRENGLKHICDVVSGIVNLCLVGDSMFLH
ncbi:hypothetical protein QQ045_027608 [Rhodiola kirilowii]